MTHPQRIVVFSLDEGRYGLDLEATERVLPALEVTPLPRAPAIVLGVINLHGRIIPVVDVRRRFGLPERSLSPQDRFVVTRAGGRTLALVVDAVAGVSHLQPADVVSAESVLGRLPHVAGVARLPDGLVLLHDLATFLALDEALALERALEQQRAEAASR